MELTQQDLCARFDKSIATVRRMVKHSGVTPRWDSGQPHFSPAQVDSIKSAWSERAARMAKSRARKVKASWRDRRNGSNGHSKRVLSLKEVKARAGR